MDEIAEDWLKYWEKDEVERLRRKTERKEWEGDGEENWGENWWEDWKRRLNEKIEWGIWMERLTRRLISRLRGGLVRGMRKRLVE